MQDLQNLYDSFPDQEPLLDFDPFLIGDGSADLMKFSDQRSGSGSNQISGVESYRDLVRTKEVPVKDLIDDLSMFNKPVQLFSGDSLDYFFKRKRDTLLRYDWLKKKSQSLGRVVSERDLVLSDSDKYLVECTSDNHSEKYLSTLADLSAYKDMRISEVKFINISCDCELCRSHDGLIYELKSLLSDMVNADFLHEGFSGLFIPVTDESPIVDTGHFEDVPVEIVPLLGEYSTDKIIKFVDFSGITKWSGECVIEEDSEILVHSGNIGCLGPLDFLSKWFSEENFEQGSEEILYYNGYRVSLRNGQYFNIDTGKYLEV